MNQTAIDLYRHLQQDLDQCIRKELGIEEEVEICFRIAEKYWVKLQQMVAAYSYENYKEEITFFKVIKPKFTSEIEYFTLRYHAELFCKAVNNPKELNKFWTREFDRLKRFISENQRFYFYYKTGCTEKDQLYFTREGCDPGYTSPKVYDTDNNASTSHDHLIASILALERYTSFVKKELQSLAEKVQ